jgi:hypothetical protein
MQEQRITFDIAVLAKKYGFSVGTRAVFIKHKKSYVYDGDPNHGESYKKGEIAEDGDFYTRNNSIYDLSGTYNEIYERPTQALLTKWFREIHKIDIHILRSFSMFNSYHYEIVIDNADFETKNQQYVEPNRTYEQALEDAFLHAFKILKKNKKIK